MTEKEELKLKNKVVDYRRFAFILLALSGFLMIGVVLPNQSAQVNSQLMLLIATGILLVLSVIMHLISKRTTKLLNQENE
ncbi:YrhC family protein [Salipaludibacillus daqingensis]|uniref:YrhC family protein n=1 Tax=Salipaludibacillus daqingensis TaxID=3041001 RepID=UPI0024770175|nr:YrhC family protein [Salipaludibacillus daqingensis]